MGGDYTYVTIRRWGSLGITLEAGYHNWFVGNFLKLIITSINTNKNVPGFSVDPETLELTTLCGWRPESGQHREPELKKPTESLKVLFQVCMSQLLSSKPHFL